MKLLAVDSSSVTASVTVAEDEKIIAEFFVNAGLTHSETLAPMISACLKNSSCDLSDVDYFVVTQGPGSFTGLRIGLSTVKGMALPFNKPCVGVSSLMAAAYNFWNFEGLICVCMDARRGQFYNAIFEAHSGKIKRLTADRAISAEDLACELEKNTSLMEFVGDGAQLCYNDMVKNHNISNIRLASRNMRYIRGEGLIKAGAELIKEGNILSAQEINPQYLRVSQAERLLKEGKLKSKVECL